jgi:hypothetical protein
VVSPPKGRDIVEGVDHEKGKAAPISEVVAAKIVEVGASLKETKLVNLKRKLMECKAKIHDVKVSGDGKR